MNTTTSANITTNGTNVHLGVQLSGKWFAECGTSPRSYMRVTNSEVSCTKCLKKMAA